MTLRRTKRASNGSKSQLGLFRPETHHADISAPGNESKNHKNAEEIKARNRAAALQPFVFKYHRTRKPHYDFRLGHLDMLKSWALDTGPSYYPEHKRKAIQVEDHLRAHMSFEGIFPEGTHGAGPTMVVDTGMWEPLPEYFDLEDSLRRGCLKFKLYGTILKGVWTLTRQGQGPASGPNPVWYLTKEPDAFMMSEEKANRIFEVEPVSILTKRTMMEIEREWNEGKDKSEPEPTLFNV